MSTNTEEWKAEEFMNLGTVHAANVGMNSGWIGNVTPGNLHRGYRDRLPGEVETRIGNRGLGAGDQNIPEVVEVRALPPA